MRKVKTKIWILIAVYVMAIFALMYFFDKEKRYVVQGEVWEGEDFYAPYDFAIEKDKDSLKAEIKLARKRISPVYEADTQIVKTCYEKVIEDITIFHQKVGEYIANGDKTEAEDFLSTHYPTILPADYTYIISNNWKNEILGKTKNILFKVYQHGYLNTSVDSFQSPTIAIRISPQLEKKVSKDSFLTENSLPNFLNQHLFTQLAKEKEGEKNIKLLKLILTQELHPNYHFNDSLTHFEMQRISELVSPVYGKIAAKSAIILNGQVVSAEKAKILNSYFQNKDSSWSNPVYRWELFGRFAVICLLSAVLLVFLMFNRSNIFMTFNKLFLLLTVMFLTLATMLFMLKIKFATDIFTLSSGIYFAPACLVPIIISSFFDTRTSSMCNMIIALYGAILVQNGTEYAFVQIVTGTTAVYSLRLLSKREHLFYTILYILIAYVVSYLSFHFYTSSTLTTMHWQNLTIFGLNVLATTLAYPLIYVFEKFFKVTSDLTFLELLDTNHPILRELATIAPGTFQHSLQVANLAEKAVIEIRGNALLTHVGALYHDIGKLKNPTYFIENNRGGENPHLKLTPLESAQIILGHVKTGMDLAEKHGLPKEIKDFIETHHGTTLVEYFYHAHLQEQAKSDKPELAQEQVTHLFSYDGPKPITKETAVVMLADSVEAASRSLKNYSEPELRNLVNRIIDHKIQAKQLNNSHLTFSDVERIRQVLVKQLVTIYHTRTEYPR